MRIANLAHRAVLITDGPDGTMAIDVAAASDGRFGPEPRDIFEQWDVFTAWASSADNGRGTPFDPADLEAPVPDPRQIFAIGLNYRDHADEAELAHPDELIVFTKFASSIAGPNASVTLPSGTVDWETELVIVIGRETHRADVVSAKAAIAGYSVGQDYSDRAVQLRGPVPQFSLGKSFPNFAPFGPAVVTPDELGDPGALSITAVIQGPTAGDEASLTLQDGTTADLIFPVERIVSDLSQVVTLYPGDVIFTGTPAGVGAPRGMFLKPGDSLTSTIAGIGSLTNNFVAR